MRRSIVPAVLTVALVVGLLWHVRRSTVGSPAVIPAVAAPATPGPAAPHPGWLQCDAVTAAPASDSAVAPIEAELYRAILAQASLTEKIDALVVEAVSIPIRRLPPDRGWTTPWPGGVEQLAREGEPACFAQTADRFPAGAHLVAANEIPREPRELAARFDGARQSFAFSRARFDHDFLDAVVYYDQFGVGYGAGKWVWFHRDHRGEPWRIAGTLPSWMT